jgi:hypothetical protein
MSDYEMVTDIPVSVVESIYDILLKVLDVEVPYSSDGLEMAEIAIARQRAGIEQAATLLYKHSFLSLGKECSE